MANSVSPDSSRVFGGAVWSLVERISTQGLTFVATLVMARILTPDDFGLVGMLSIFIDLGAALCVAGLSQALIRRGGGTPQEASSAACFNIVVGVAFYIVIWFSAPFIARFYNIPILIPIARALALAIPLKGAFTVIFARLSANFDFKKIACVNIGALSIAGIAGIWSAVAGFGVWAIVIFQISNAIFSLLFYLLLSHTFSYGRFSFKSLKELLAFGSHISGATLADIIYNNSFLMAIGRMFPVADVGLFSRARQLSVVPPISISEIIRRVAYPALCAVAGRDDEFGNRALKILNVGMYVSIPVMTAIALNASPLIETLLGSKWIGAAEMIPWLCIASVWVPLDALNLTLLPAAGMPNLLLRLELARKGIGIFALLCALPFGIKAVCIGYAVGGCLSTILCIIVSRKYFNLGFARQLLPLVNPVAIAAIACFCGFRAASLFSSPLLKSAIGIGGAWAIYFCVSLAIKYPAPGIIINGLKNFFNRPPLS